MAITPGENPFEWQGLGEDPNKSKSTGTGRPANNYYNQNGFGTGLPGQQPGFGAQPTFDPNGLPDQGQSPDGSGGAPGAYTNPNGDPFNQPKLDGSLGDRNGSGGASGGPGLRPEAPLAGPGYLEDLYKDHGRDLIDNQSASEDLYSRGVNASNPYYDFAQQQAIKSINDSASASGGFNSSYTQNLIGKTVADIRGQQAHELGQLAGQADENKRGRYDSSFKYAGDAQDQMEDRANMGLDRDIKIAEGRSGLVGGFYGKAGDETQQAIMARIEAELKKSGLTAAEAKQQADQMMAAMEIYSKFYGAGGGGGGGSGISTPGSGGGGGGGGGTTWYV